jgi:hypothetical protein
VLPPPLDQHLRLRQRVEDLAVQEFVPQLAVEARHVAVLPRAARLDVQRPNPRPPQPVPDRPGDELRPVVAAQVPRRAPPALT